MIEPADESASAHPYAMLSPDTVIDAVESLGFLSDARILALNSYENRVYQVGREEGDPVIAKFYRPGRWTDEQILEEHRFTAFLAELEIPVVAPLSYAGNTLHQFSAANGQVFRFTLYPRQGGRSPELDNLDHLYQLGQFIGRIHAAAETFLFEHRIALTFTGFGENSVRYLLENDFIPDDLHHAYESLANDLLNALRRVEWNKYRQLSLHGDCHPGNVLWRDERPHFVDFDDALTGPAIQDLWMLLSGDREQQRSQMEEIVEGYSVFHALDLSELKLIEPLRCLRVLHYNSWLASRWDDPAFPLSFPWFNTPRYWSEHILELRELMAGLNEPHLSLLNI